MNPNETILIPLLNRRMGELLSQNIVLEAKNILLEQENESLKKQIEDLTHTIEKFDAVQKKKVKKENTTFDGATY